MKIDEEVNFTRFKTEHLLANAEVRLALPEWAAAPTSTCKTGGGENLVEGQHELPLVSMRMWTRGKPGQAQLQYPLTGL